MGDRFFAVLMGANFYEGFDVEVKKGGSKIYIFTWLGMSLNIWRVRGVIAY